jgi:hypothetical protein
MCLWYDDEDEVDIEYIQIQMIDIIRIHHIDEVEVDDKLFIARDSQY